MTDADAGGEDRADVTRSAAAELDGSLQSGDQGVATVGGFEGSEFIEVAAARLSEGSSGP